MTSVPPLPIPNREVKARHSDGIGFALREYEKIEQQARAEYEKIRQQARAEYEKIEQQAAACMIL